METGLEPGDDNETKGEEIIEDQPVDDEPDLAEDSLSDLEMQPPIEKFDEGEDGILSTWVWLLAAVLLLGSALVVHRIRNSRSLIAQAEAKTIQASSAPAQDSDDKPAYPVPGLDSLLIIEGILSDGTQFRQAARSAATRSTS